MRRMMTALQRLMYGRQVPLFSMVPRTLENGQRQPKANTLAKVTCAYLVTDRVRLLLGVELTGLLCTDVDLADCSGSFLNLDGS
jgi:hypothetical protein